jgi:hypothetical protein
MQLPGPVRAIVGLIAVTAEEAKHLPDRAIELPMLAVSSALQMSLRAQQRYARLAARGDDVINRRSPGDEPPSWATFDAPVSDTDLRAVGLADPDPSERARAASQLLDELLSGVDGERSRTPAEPTRLTPVKKSTPAKSPGKTASATSASKKQPAKKQPAKRAAKKATDKSINAPRHTAPSRFDTVEDD